MSLRQAREARIARERSERKDLVRRMNPYNRLSNKSKSLPSDFKSYPETTVHDILSNLGERRSRRSRRGLVNSIVDEIKVSDEVRAQWQAKIAPSLAPLSTETKQKLIAMTNNFVQVPTYDELKLIAMVQSIVRTWKPINKLY